jgi:DNA-binding HxlR family transcriptional regulator
MTYIRGPVNADCSLIRSLEVVGDRWTLLIVRDVFFGVQRFGDFAEHLGIPRAILTKRLALLTSEGVLDRVASHGGRDHYELTDKGKSLWFVVRTLTSWGDEHYAPAGAPRLFFHSSDDGLIDAGGFCGRCGSRVHPDEITVAPGPGLPALAHADDAVTRALSKAHRLLDPIEH